MVVGENTHIPPPPNKRITDQANPVKRGLSISRSGGVQQVQTNGLTGAMRRSHQESTWEHGRSHKKNNNILGLGTIHRCLRGTAAPKGLFSVKCNGNVSHSECTQWMSEPWKSMTSAL